MRIVWNKRAYERFLQVSAWYAGNTIPHSVSLYRGYFICRSPSRYADERIIKIIEILWEKESTSASRT